MSQTGIAALFPKKLPLIWSFIFCLVRVDLLWIFTLFFPTAYEDEQASDIPACFLIKDIMWVIESRDLIVPKANAFSG